MGTCRIYRLTFLTSLCYLAALSPPAQAQQALSIPNPLPPVNVRKIDFNRDIQPILSKNCYACHGSAMQMNGLRWDRRESVLAGGDSGPVIKPGNSAQSELILMVTGATGKVMPPSGDRLTPEQIGLLRAWIDQGAAWPDETPSAKDAGSEPAQPKKKHWTFIAPSQPEIPQVRNRAWVKNPIDAFVLAKFEAGGIEPSPEADRIQLLRRVTLDLIGLPPTPEEVDQFLADERPDAYERVVDRLLASPHYGEKWARHWLDLARYADSDGYNDRERPYAWRYREWVINALNSDMPFNQFTIEQVAGDLLPNATVEQKVATGFHRNTLTNRETGTDREEFRTEQVIDRTSTLGTVWLGLTVGCARCHDHKYDPISQKEFYQLYAFFNSAVEVNIEAPLSGELGPYLRNKPEYDRKRHELLVQYKVAELQADWEKKVLEAADDPKADLKWVLAWKGMGWQFDGGQDILRTSPSQRTANQQDRLTDFFVGSYANVVGDETYKELKLKELSAKLEQLKVEYPGLTQAQTLAEGAHPPQSHVLIRGDFRRPGVEVQPGTPAVLPPLPADSNPTRLTLARWLVSKDNPLTARVTVNRMWQEFFGRGLVETSEDFGTRGDRPTHPELLDWLATEFEASGWDVKRMHKLIVTSATYRQSSRTRKDLQARDPENKLLARQSRLRLPAELIRDETLAASGLLNPAVGGRSVRPPRPTMPGLFTDWQESQGADAYRRGVYITFRRGAPYPQLVNFDAPDAQQACSRRERSTTPLAALNLLNDPVFFEAARALAARVLRERPTSTLSDRIDYAVRLCLARSPTEAEKARLARYYQTQLEIFQRDPTSMEKVFPAEGVDGIKVKSDVAAWVGLSSGLLNLDEFITRE